MKKLVLLCGVAMLVFASSAAFAAKTYEINFPSPYFDRHPTVVRVFKPWTQEMDKLSKGQLKITYFAPNTVCPEPEIMDSVAKGSIEMGGNSWNRNAGRLTMGEVSQIPMLSRSPRAFAMAWWDVSQKYPQYAPEFQKDIKLLFVWASALTQVHTTKKPVRKLEDIKGLKFIGWTPPSLEYIKVLGGIPMFQSSADTYLALERGMADGVFCPIAPLRSQKLTDILKYHTIVDLALSPFWGGMNRALFDSMPADLQKLLLDNTGLEFSGVAAQSLEDGANEDIEWIRKQGKAEIILLSDAERARWTTALAPLKDSTIKKVVASGYSEKEVLTVYDYFIERIAYHTENSLKK